MVSVTRRIEANDPSLGVAGHAAGWLRRRDNRCNPKNPQVQGAAPKASGLTGGQLAMLFIRVAPELNRGLHLCDVFYFGNMVTNTLLYLDNGGVPLSVTLKIN